MRASRMSANYLTPDDIRTYLVDSSPADNELLDDLDFKDGQIKLAMRMMAAAFNEIPPYTMQVDALRMPLREWAMMGVQEQLYRMRLNQLERNAFQLQAGNTGFDEDATRISNLRAALDRVAGWRKLAAAEKITVNITNTYDCGF